MLFGWCLCSVVCVCVWVCACFFVLILEILCAALFIPLSLTLSGTKTCLVQFYSTSAKFYFHHTVLLLVYYCALNTCCLLPHLCLLLQKTSMSNMKPALPRLGLGMAALGRPGYINLNRESILGNDRPVELMQKQADLVMDKLFALSSSGEEDAWLDCARSYGLSEKFVGEYLRSRKIPADQVYVSSKWGYSK